MIYEEPPDNSDIKLVNGLTNEASEMLGYSFYSVPHDFNLQSSNYQH